MGKSRWPLWAASDPLAGEKMVTIVDCCHEKMTSLHEDWYVSLDMLLYHWARCYQWFSAKKLVELPWFTRRFLLLMSMFLISLSIFWWLLHHISPYIAILCGPFFCCNPSHHQWLAWQPRRARPKPSKPQPEPSLGNVRFVGTEWPGPNNHGKSLINGGF